MKRVITLMCMAIYFFSYRLQAQPGSLLLGTLIDVPTTKTISMGGLETELRMYAGGGLLTSLRVGITYRFSLGVSYGGENIVGTGDVNLNPQPCVHIQYLFMDEQFLIPAIVVGFNSQGFGGYDKTLKRYKIKSRGLYAVASKNTSFLGGIGLHGGLSWSLEKQDGDSDPTLFLGCHKWLNSELVILGEYDAAINDNNENALGRGKGYLNAGVRWIFKESLFVEFAWKNILENVKNIQGSSREIKLVYVTHF